MHVLFVGLEDLAPGQGDMVPVHVFYQLTDPDQTATNSHNYDRERPLVQVATTCCPATATPQQMCLLVSELTQHASRGFAAVVDGYYYRPLQRPIAVGDVISVGGVFYLNQSTGFEPLLQRPANLTRFVIFPDLP